MISQRMDGFSQQGSTLLASFLQSHGKSQIAEPDQVIFLEGEAAENVQMVLSGTVRCCTIAEDGRRHIFSFASAGRFIGLPGITVRHFTAEAVTRARLQVIPRAAFEAALDEREEIAIAVQELMRTELRTRERHLLRLASLPAEPRLLSFLAELAGQSGPDMRSDAGFVNLPMSRREIADHLGLTLETVSRAFSMLRRRGQLELRSKSVFRLIDETDPKDGPRSSKPPMAARSEMADTLYEGAMARS